MPLVTQDSLCPLILSLGARRCSQDGPVLLMYHSVTPGSAVPSNRWAVSHRQFREQMRLLKKGGWHTACVRDLEHPERLPRRSVLITFDDGFADNFEQALPVLLENGQVATWFVVSGNLGRASSWHDPGAPSRMMLSAPQLREMDRLGMEIGAHTRNHPRLPSLSAYELTDEVAGSRRDLETLLGCPVTSFAYPLGLWDERCLQAVRQAGFRAACSTSTGRLGDELDPLKLRRVAVFAHDTLSSWSRKLFLADTDVRWEKVARRGAALLAQTLAGA